MNLRIASLSKEQFEVCADQEVWGSNQNSPLRWQQGDMLLFFVEKKVAALAEVAGEPFVSVDEIWDNGLFPYRVPLEFRFILDEDDRVPTGHVIKDHLMSAWGYNYGWGIQVKQPVPNPQADEILKYIYSQPNISNK